MRRPRTRRNWSRSITRCCDAVRHAGSRADRPADMGHGARQSSASTGPTGDEKASRGRLRQGRAHRLGRTSCRTASRQPRWKRAMPSASMMPRRTNTRSIPAIRARAACATASRTGMLNIDQREAARHLARCRRRLRHEGLCLSRAGAGADRGEEGRPAGALVARNAPKPSWPTHHGRDMITTGRTGAGQGRQDSRAAHHRHGRIWAAICRSSRRSFRRLRAAAFSAASIAFPQLFAQRQGLFHQHRAGRCLSRRRPSRSRLSDGAADG